MFFYLYEKLGLAFEGYRRKKGKGRDPPSDETEELSRLDRILSEYDRLPKSVAFQAQEAEIRGKVRKTVKEYCRQRMISWEVQGFDFASAISGMAAPSWKLFGFNVRLPAFCYRLISRVAGIDFEYGVKLLEDVALLMFELSNAENSFNVRMAILHFAKHRAGNRSLITSYYERFSQVFVKLLQEVDEKKPRVCGFPDSPLSSSSWGSLDEEEMKAECEELKRLAFELNKPVALSEPYQVQGGSESFEKVLKGARGLLDKYDEVVHSKIYNRIYKLMTYAVSFSLFDKLGLTATTLQLSTIQTEALREKGLKSPDFIHSCLDTFVFVCERGYQYVKTGDFSSIFHSGSRYDEWFETTNKLRSQAPFTSNPEPHGFTRFDFLARLEKAIEQGRCISKQAKANRSSEFRFINSVLRDMELIKGEELSRANAMQSRNAPFSLLVFGTTSVAKTTFVKVICQIVHRALKLPIGDQYMYIRNSIDAFWVNFHSSQHTVVLDDIGFLEPNVAQQGDPSMLEMLQINNNIAFTPIQAALEDKGKTPMRAKLLVATTNTEHLNVQAYFSCPAAVSRRFPYVIQITLKDEFANEDGTLDGSKVTNLQAGEFPNYWNITVKKCVVDKPQKNQKIPPKPLASLKVIYNFTDILDFGQWLARTAISYENLQKKVDNCFEVMKDIELCVGDPDKPGCYRPVDKCTHDQPGCAPIVQGDRPRCARCRQYRIECSCLNVAAENPAVTPPPSDDDWDDTCNTCHRDFTQCTCEADLYCPDCLRAMHRCCCDFDWRDHNICPACGATPNECYCFDTSEDEDNEFLQTCRECGRFRSDCWCAFLDEVLEDDEPLPADAVIGRCPFCEELPGWCHCLELQGDDPKEIIDVVYRAEIVERETLRGLALQDKTYAVPEKDLSWRLKCSIGFWRFNWWASAHIPGFTWFLSLGFGSDWKSRILTYYATNREFVRFTLRTLGDKIERKIGRSYVIHLMLAALALSATTYAAWSLWSSFKKPKPQGGSVSLDKIFSTGTPPPRSDKAEAQPNVYYKSDYQTTDFDVGKTSLSWKAMKQSEVTEHIMANCVHLRYSFDVSGTRRATVPNKGFFMKGQLLVTNVHSLPQSSPGKFVDNFDMEVVRVRRCSGLTENIPIKVNIRQVKMYVDWDIAVIEVLDMPPFKDLTGLLPKQSLRGIHSGTYITRSENGEPTFNRVENIKWDGHLQIPLPDRMQTIKVDCWVGNSREMTKKGDCGSLLVSFSEMGPIILGSHIAGTPSSTAVRASTLTQEKWTQIETHFGIQVHSGAPVLSAPSRPVELVDLHPKSPLRFVEEGFMRVYGSVSGFRAKLKSRVAKSVICQSLLERGFKLTHGAPVMKGWGVKRNVLLTMVNPVNKLDPDILEQAANGWADDCIAGLTDDDYATLGVVDLRTAVNGAAGHQYIDSVDRSTSAGFPWRKSKKHYLAPTEVHDDGLQDPVMPSVEILERVEDCLDKYSRGERYCPVFCMNLKDEAVKFSKIAAEKTRGFCGAPFDWVIVVRMYFLTVVRLMYTCRYVFESAPGIVATSLEWQELYKHLTQFGRHRMIAGDFANFDKSMSGRLIWLVFRALFKVIWFKGNYSLKEKIAMTCIAADICFPWIYFFGDLIECFGCNPSGHPLTVLVNGIANSIYMRYCYIVLNPKHDVSTFKKHVALMTYGDDNIMGVSEDAPWFNHTAISEVLATGGIVYTMADKEAISIPYIDIDECTFLKRAFRFSPEFNAIVAPLDLTSINKALMVNVVSKSITRKAQCIATIGGALHEMSYHGRDAFERLFSTLRDVVRENELDAYVDDSTFRDFNFYVDRFWYESKRRGKTHVDLT
jgi:hypothetical protein